MACTILRKQIEHIDGKKENIKVPSVTMKRIREMKEAGSLLFNKVNKNILINNTVEAHAREQVTAETVTNNSSKNNNVEMIDLLEPKSAETTKSPGEERKNVKSCVVKNTAVSSDNASPLTNPCVVCRKDEKRLACLPCGHLIACTSCARSVRSCPICYRDVEVFVRVYL